MDHNYKGNVPKELEEIYDEIIKEFSGTRLSSSINSNRTPDISNVETDLKAFANSGDKKEIAKSILEKIYKLNLEW